MELESAIRDAVADKVDQVPALPDPVRTVLAAVRRRSRQRRTLVATVVLTVVPSVVVTYGITQAAADARVRQAEARQVIATAGPVPAPAVRACGTTDLKNVQAVWTPVSELVLSGTLQVTSAATSACVLQAPRFTLVDRTGALIDAAFRPADVLDDKSSTVLAPARTAAAVIRWGGSYCGQADRVYLKWTLLTGQDITVAVPALLHCVSTPYYDKGQTSAAASQFVLVP
jgi:hypothetical protein